MSQLIYFIVMQQHIFKIGREGIREDFTLPTLLAAIEQGDIDSDCRVFTSRDYF